MVSIHHARTILILIRAGVANEAKCVKLKSWSQGLKRDDTEEEFQQPRLSERYAPGNYIRSELDVHCFFSKHLPSRLPSPNFSVTRSSSGCPPCHSCWHTPNIAFA